MTTGGKKVDEFLRKYTSGKQKKWRLVFCVPQDVGDKWNKWQCIDYQGKKLGGLYWSAKTSVLASARQ